MGVLIGYLAIPLLSSPEQHVAEKDMPQQKYTCSMHPEVVKDAPGACPICGMDLVALTKGAESENAIEIDGRTVQNMNMRMEEAQYRMVQKKLTTFAEVDIAEEDQFWVTTTVTGWVTRLFVKETGQYVRKGQALLELYAPELAESKMNFWQALKAHNHAPTKQTKNQLNITRKRLLLWGMAKSDIDAINSESAEQPTMLIRAEKSGYITNKKVEKGQKISPANPLLFALSSLQTVWLEATVYEHELWMVELGQKVDIYLDGQGEYSTGKVDFMHPVLNRNNRSVKVRIALKNENLKFKPGSTARALIHVFEREVLAVASSALFKTGKETYLFVEKEKGLFVPQKVKLGVEGEDGYVAVVDGLYEGDRVVVSGQFLLDSESQSRNFLTNHNH